MQTEFVIIAAPHVHDFLLHVGMQLRCHLEADFPDYAFSLATRGGEGMDFVVVPVAPEFEEETPAQLVVLDAIRKSLEAFRPRLAA